MNEVLNECQTVQCNDKADDVICQWDTEQKCNHIRNLLSTHRY